MIQSNTLRIGNLVKYPFWNPEPGNERISYGFGTIHALGQDKAGVRTKDKSIIKFDYEKLEPIPITEDILVRMGFNPWKYDGKPALSIDVWQTEYDKGIRLDLDFIEGKVFMKSRYEPEKLDVQLMPRINYVHQIQNLYHSIALEELTLTDL